MRHPKIAIINGEAAYLKRLLKIGKSKALVVPVDWLWSIGDAEVFSITFDEEKLIVRPYRGTEPGKGAN